MPLTDEDSTKKSTLTLAQIRVLRVLGEEDSPLTLSKIASRIGTVYAYASRVVGCEDPERRARMEAGEVQGGKALTLITLNAVEKFDMDIDGVREVGYELTEEGRRLLASVADVVIPEFTGRKLNRKDKKGVVECIDVSDVEK